MFNNVDDDVMEWIDRSTAEEVAYLLYGLDRDKALDVATYIEQEYMESTLDKDTECMLLEDDELVLNQWYGGDIDMYYMNEYPSWSEVREDMSYEDMADILDRVMSSNDESVEDLIDEWIESNYEPMKVPDYDRAYDEYRDEMLFGDEE